VQYAGTNLTKLNGAQSNFYYAIGDDIANFSLLNVYKNPSYLSLTQKVNMSGAENLFNVEIKLNTVVSITL